MEFVKISFSCLAQVVKLVDTPDLGSGAVRCVGSSPILGTLTDYFVRNDKIVGFLFCHLFQPEWKSKESLLLDRL